MIALEIEAEAHLLELAVFEAARTGDCRMHVTAVRTGVWVRTSMSTVSTVKISRPTIVWPQSARLSHARSGARGASTTAFVLDLRRGSGLCERWFLSDPHPASKLQTSSLTTVVQCPPYLLRQRPGRSLSSFSSYFCS